MTLVAFGSEKLDIFTIGDELSIKGWQFDRQQGLETLHLTVSNGHEHTVDAFLEDLKSAVSKARKPSLHKTAAKVQVNAVKNLRKLLPDGMIARINAAFSSGEGLNSKRTAAMYGMMTALSGTGDLHEIVLDALDSLNRVEPAQKASTGR